MSAGGFVMVPGWLLERRPSGSALLVYCNLGAHGTWNPGSGKYDECRPAVPTIAEETGLSENTVRKGIRELAELAAIEAGAPRYDERGGQLPTVYKVVFGQVNPPVQNLNPPGSKPEGEGVQKDTPGGVPKSEPNQEPSTKNPDTKTEKASPSRAHRLPEGWKPSPELGAWCLETLVPGKRWTAQARDFVLTETEMFCDHFRANGKPYKDWDATWRNWMRRSFRRFRPTAVGGVAPTSGAPQGQYLTAAEKAAIKTERDKVRAHLVDALMDRGASFQDAYKAAEGAVRAKEAAGEPIRMDLCTVSGYIDDNVIDGSSVTREVTS